MDDAAFSIRQYVAALWPTNSGFYDESMNAKLAGATACRVELRPI
jgi:hypothetical protein